MNMNAAKMSEMHVQSSFVHNFVKSLFKPDEYHSPHCSNSICNMASTRPDYIVDVYESASDKFVNAFGECKPKRSFANDVVKDIYRLVLFSQVAMK